MPTPTKTPPRKSQPAKQKKNKQERLNSLLNAAMKHPGVADVMKVYQSSVAVEETFSFYQIFQNPCPNTFTGASSTHALFES